MKHDLYDEGYYDSEAIYTRDALIPSIKPKTFKYFKVWEKPTGYSVCVNAGPGEEQFEEVKRVEISKEEYNEHYK